MEGKAARGPRQVRGGQREICSAGLWAHHAPGLVTPWYLCCSQSLALQRHGRVPTCASAVRLSAAPPANIPERITCSLAAVVGARGCLHAPHILSLPFSCYIAVYGRFACQIQKNTLEFTATSLLIGSNLPSWMPCKHRCWCSCFIIAIRLNQWGCFLVVMDERQHQPACLAQLLHRAGSLFAWERIRV